MDVYLLMFHGLEALAYAGALLSLYSLFYQLFSWPVRRFRWRRYRFDPKKISRLRRLIRRLFAAGSSDVYEEIDQLLKACKIPLEGIDFVAFKRAALSVIALTSLSVYMLSRTPFISKMFMTLYIIAAVAVGLALLTDKLWLSMIAKQRSRLIVKEVYTLSNQILYYGGSNMNLHGKLSECLPHTRILRRELQLLLREWYEDVDRALIRFKQRIGTDEGYSFAETLHAIRMHDSEPYYDLLRQRIKDYKEKMELHKESRREATSYLLFVMAGIPILNTFRVFIYPWMAEGQRLFQMLG